MGGGVCVCVCLCVCESVCEFVCFTGIWYKIGCSYSNSPENITETTKMNYVIILLRYHKIELHLGDTTVYIAVVA